MAEHPFRSNVLLWRVFRRELEETGVSLTCSPATIHGPRTTTGVLPSPKLLGGLTGNTDATGPPKHPHSVNPHRGAARRGATTNPAAGTEIFIVHGAAKPPLQLLATNARWPAGPGPGPGGRRGRPAMSTVAFRSGGRDTAPCSDAHAVAAPPRRCHRTRRDTPAVCRPASGPARAVAAPAGRPAEAARPPARRSRRAARWCGRRPAS